MGALAIQRNAEVVRFRTRAKERAQEASSRQINVDSSDEPSTTKQIDLAHGEQLRTHDTGGSTAARQMNPSHAKVIAISQQQREHEAEDVKRQRRSKVANHRTDALAREEIRFKVDQKKEEEARRRRSIFLGLFGGEGGQAAETKEEPLPPKIITDLQVDPSFEAYEDTWRRQHCELTISGGGSSSEEEYVEEWGLERKVDNEDKKEGYDAFSEMEENNRVFVLEPAGESLQSCGLMPPPPSESLRGFGVPIEGSMVGRLSKLGQAQHQEQRRQVRPSGPLSPSAGARLVPNAAQRAALETQAAASRARKREMEGRRSSQQHQRKNHLHQEEGVNVNGLSAYHLHTGADIKAGDSVGGTSAVPTHLQGSISRRREEAFKATGGGFHRLLPGGNGSRGGGAAEPKESLPVRPVPAAKSSRSRSRALLPSLEASMAPPGRESPVAGVGGIFAGGLGSVL